MSAETKRCPMCAETIMVEAKVCEYCGAQFEVTVIGGQTVSKFIEEPSAPRTPPAQQVPIPAPAPAPPLPKSKRNLWPVVIIAILIVGVIGGLVWFGGKSLLAALEPTATATRVPTRIPTKIPTRTPNYAATQQARDTQATESARSAWVNDFAGPILSDIRSHSPNFEDDFSTTSGRFVRWSSLSPGVTFTEGVMRARGENWNGAGGSMIATDFVIEFDVTPRTISSGSSFSVTFRSANDQWYNFGCNFYDDWCGMMVFLPGIEPYAISDRMSGTDPKQKRTILVIARGDEFAFYVNGEPFAYARDDRLKGTWIDIGLWSSPGVSEVEFDNVKFWDLNNLKQ